MQQQPIPSLWPSIVVFACAAIVAAGALGNSIHSAAECAAMASVIPSVKLPLTSGA